MRLAPTVVVALLCALLPLPMAAQAPAQPPDLARITARGAQLDPLNALLVWRGESLEVESYWRGMRAERPVNVKSVSKTLLSPLVGIAIERGLLPGTDATLAELLPERFEGIDDPAKRGITLHDLLSMTTGLEGTSFGNYGAWVASSDWIDYALEQPVVCARGGGCMTYSTGNSHLASAILTRATGMSTRDFFDEALFDALEIPVRRWDRGPDGVYLGGNNMSLTPHEMLRFGRLFLNRGVWDGRQLVPRDWIRRSWGSYTTSPWNGHRYGYFWWTREFGGETVRFAWGYGGQFIFIVPRLELVVVMTSSLTDRPRGIDHNDRLYRFLGEVIIPEFRGDPSPPLPDPSR